MGVYLNYVDCRPVGGFICIYDYASVWLFLVLCFSSFCCFLCRPPLVAASPVGQLLCNLWLEKCLASWEGKYSSFVGFWRSDWEAGQPAVLTAGRRGWRPSLCYISSLVLSRFSCGHPFCLWLLLVGQSVLRTATLDKRAWETAHYLSNFR